MLMQINASIFKDCTITIPSFLEDQYPIDWSMSRMEQYCLTQLLQKLRPKVAIEIGTYNGGSLQVLKEYCDKVYAIDFTPEYRDQRCDNFDNVEFIIGDSKTEIPKLISQLKNRNEALEFILIDGDHSETGVLSDITNCLNYSPKTQLTIVLHDSFNPNCRRGMKAYDYQHNNYIHYVELDFIGGVFNHDGLYRQMWGGFALIIALAEKRTQKLTISECQSLKYKIVYYQSIHFIRRLLRPFKLIFNRLTKSTKT